MRLATMGVLDPFVRTGWDPAGREVLVGVTTYLWQVVVVAAMALVAIHFLLHRFGGKPIRDRIPEISYSFSSDEPSDSFLQRVFGPADKDPIRRYDQFQRVFYWGGGLILLIHFWSELALQFPTPTGLFGDPPLLSWTEWQVLTNSLLGVLLLGYAVVLIQRKGFRSVWLTKENLRHIGGSIEHFLGLKESHPRSGKYSPVQLGLHWLGIALVGVGMVLGLVRARLIATPLWEGSRHPFGLSEATTGMVFTVRGATFALLLAVILFHLYFALRKWEVSKSIITGTIDMETYRKYFDPDKWQPQEVKIVAGDGGQGDEITGGTRPANDTRRER